VIRINIVAEGPTEQGFVTQVLAPYLGERGVAATSRSVYTSRDGPYWYRGGMTTYLRARRDIERWLSQDSTAYVSSMFDLYRLPNDFPGMPGASKDPVRRVAELEQALGKEIGNLRFIPYLQLHEFEALVLTEPEALELLYPSSQDGVRRLREDCAGYDSPELINDEEPPSKRICARLPDYDKRVAGIQILQYVGVDQLLARCPHFREWIAKILALVA
jgi:hypothetical protein